MATWVRNGTGTAPNSTGANLTGTYELDNATAPGDFDPDAVTSVRIEYTITGASFVDDHWANAKDAQLTLNGGGTALATINGTGIPSLGNEASDTDETDSTIPTGYTAAQWEGTELNESGTGYAQYTAEMKNDDGTLTMSALTVTITYTPAGASITPGLASQLVTTFDPTLATGSVSITPGLAQQLTTAFNPTVKDQKFITPGLAQQLAQAFDPNVYQWESTSFRWSTDTTLTSPSWLAAEDTGLPIDTFESNENYLLYHQLGWDGQPWNRSMKLYYRINGGAWVWITASSAAVRFYDSANVTDGLVWTVANFQLTAGARTQEDGSQIDTGYFSSESRNIDYEQERVFSLEFVSGQFSEGDVVEFTYGDFNAGPSYVTAGIFAVAYVEQSMSPDLAQQLTVAFDPTVSMGGDYIFPDLAQSLAQAFDPTVKPDQLITPPLATELVNAFDPTLTREALLKLVAFELTGTYTPSAGVYILPDLASQLAQAFDPTVALGSFSITPGLASQLAQAFDPTLAYTYPITPGLAQQLAQAFDPTIVWEQFITPGLAQQLTVAFDPTVAVGSVSITPDLATSLVTPFDPTLAYTYSVAPGLATSLATAFDPTVAAGPVTLTPDLAQSLAVGFDPSIVLDTQYILPGLASQLVTPFGPLVTIFGGDQYVAPDLVQQLVTPFDPTIAAGSVSMTPGLASSLAQAFDPTITTGAAAITPGLAQSLATPFDPTLTSTYGITPGLASNVAVAFEPSIATGSVSLTPGLATSLAQAFDPTVALGADYIFPDLAQQLTVAFEPAGIAQTQNIAPPLTSQLVEAFDPFVDLGTKYALPELASSLFVAFSPVIMHWMPTLPGVTSPTGQLGGTTSRPTKVATTTGSDEYAVTSSGGGLAYTDPET